MAIIGGLGILLFVLAAGCLGLGSAVVRLSNETFIAHLEANPLALVAFCVPWYEPCQNLYPELDAAAEVLHPKEITVASVDCTAEVKLCSDFNVTSYPALRVLRGPENVARFREKRTAKAIISSMLRLTLQAVSVVTKDNIEDLRSVDMPLIIAFVDEDDQQSTELFKAIAEGHQDRFLFAMSSDMSFAKAATTIKPPFIVMQTASDHIDRILTNLADRSKVEHFLGQVSRPLIGKFSMQTYYTYTQSALPLLHIFATSEEERQSLAEALQPIAEQHSDEMNFATVDAAQYGFFAEALGLPAGVFPALLIEDVMSGATAPFEKDENENINVDAVGEFVGKFFNARRSTADIAQGGDNHDEL